MAKIELPKDVYYVRYSFCGSQFHHVVNAESAEDAIKRTLASFKQLAYPMGKVTIGSAALYELVEGPLERGGDTQPKEGA